MTAVIDCDFDNTTDDLVSALAEYRPETNTIAAKAIITALFASREPREEVLLLTNDEIDAILFGEAPVPDFLFDIYNEAA